MPLSQSQIHYLFNVMRRSVGDTITVFNGRDGAWVCELVELQKKVGSLLPLEHFSQQTGVPDLWLLFAPVKRSRTEWIVEKATEIGVSCIQPVMTQFTNTERLRIDRLHSIAIEASEQSERLCVPTLKMPIALTQLLDEWPEGRSLVFADETNRDISTALPTMPSAILIGPEGGFSSEERARIRQLPGCTSIGLGPRILRADTAVVAALSILQSRVGDWK